MTRCSSIPPWVSRNILSFAWFWAISSKLSYRWLSVFEWFLPKRCSILANKFLTFDMIFEWFRVLNAFVFKLQLLWADGKCRAFIGRRWATTTQKSHHPKQQVPHVPATCANSAQEQQPQQPQYHIIPGSRVPEYQPNVRLPRFQRKEPSSKLNTCRIISFLPPTPVVPSLIFLFLEPSSFFSVSIQNKYWERWAVVVPMDKVRQQRAFLPLSWAYISIFWG